MIRNMLLQEAIETKSGADAVVASIKKLMNTAKLTKYKSTDSCAKFYSTFFLCTLPEDVEAQPTVNDWGYIYTALLSNDPFCADLAAYMALYHPAIYTGIFSPLWGLIQSEVTTMKQNRVRYLTLTKTMIAMLQTRMAGVGELVRSQINDPEALKFVTIVDQVLNQMVFDLTSQIQTEIAKAADPDDIVYSTKGDASYLSETAEEIISLLESADAFIDQKQAEYLDEGIVNNVKESAKATLVAKKKAENEFDEFVMKKVKKLREERRNKKHAEMVGESLRINREIKRLLRSGAIGILNPAWGVISYVISVVYDRATDKKDRAILVGQLKDELEIVEEKIQMAERNGDEKARIELIRFRQKLQREYERIQRMRWDPQTRARVNR